MSSLKVGADLSYVFCSENAVTAIKSYSPELIVTSFYDSKKYNIFPTGHPDPNNLKTEQLLLFNNRKLDESLSRYEAMVLVTTIAIAVIISVTCT